jgi:hypothetical protein
LSVWRDGEEEHAKGVSGESGEFTHTWISPDDDLVLTVPVRANDFIHVFTPYQVAHLRTGIDALQRGVCDSIPEANTPICGATATSKQSMLMRTPGDGFHRRSVVTAS